MIIPDKCKTLREREMEEIQWRIFWIFFREYFLANDPGQLVEWESLEDKPWYNIPGISLDVDIPPELYESVRDAFEGHLPGWSTEKCSMNWLEFACFCRWAVNLDKEDFEYLLANMANGKRIWQEVGRPCPQEDDLYQFYIQGVESRKQIDWGLVITVASITMSVLALYRSAGRG